MQQSEVLEYWGLREGSERETRKGMDRQRGDQREGPLGVWLGHFYIESSYVTRSELVEGKLSKLGKIFDKVNGLLFFGQKKKARDLKADGAAITAINHSCHSWLMTSFAWRTILGIKFMIWLKMVR